MRLETIQAVSVHRAACTDRASRYVGGEATVHIQQNPKPDTSCEERRDVRVPSTEPGTGQCSTATLLILQRSHMGR